MIEKKVTVPAFVEMKDGSFRSAADGQITVEGNSKVLMLDGVRYRTMRCRLQGPDGDFYDADQWVLDNN